MKTSNYLKSAGIMILAAVLLNSCSKDSAGGPDLPDSDKYVLITMSENKLEKPGFATTFNSLPSGDVVNNGENSFQGLGFGGWRPYGNWLLKMFNSNTNDLGIERLGISGDGSIYSESFITSQSTTNGTGNFVIENDQSGFYWDGAQPLAIQTFDPTGMKRTGEIDLSAVVNERGQEEAGILFRSIGQKFLAVKNGKLYANITYATTDGTQKGFWDDYYPDVYIAVIDIKTQQYEKTIKIEDTGSIAYINDNNMYDFDSNGDLYIVTQGRSALGGKSKIVRIKNSESDIDDSWSLNMDDIMTGGKFVSVFAKDGKIITLIPNAALTGGPTGNINFKDVWDFYSIDIASQERTKISGLPSVTNPGAAFAAIEIDGKILLRVTTESGEINGYYQLEGNSASPVFNVTAGGSVSGLHKVSSR